MKIAWYALLSAFVTFRSASAATDKIVCYHGTWSTYRWGNGKFDVANIDPTLCTHLIYTFVGINSNDGSIKLLDSYLDIDRGNFKQFNQLKTQNPKAKTLVAIGGWNEGSTSYSQVAADPQKRANLIKSAVNLLQTYGFDGFDIDWEYPAQRGGAPQDKQNYITLLKELREEFDKHGYILTVAVAAAAGSVDLSYDVPSVSKYVDIINVMAYDLHGSWDGVTGQNAPLYASSKDVTANQKSLNVDAAIRGWLKRGADPQKIALGLGAYGRTYTLSNPSNNGVNAPAPQPGTAGRFTQQAGMLGYNEIVELLSGGGWTEVWDDEQKTPYAYKGNQWIGFDNAKSVAIKAQYAKSLNLAGVMLWSVETEDFKGLSGTKYPLLKAARDVLSGNSDNNLNPDEPDNNSDKTPKPDDNSNKSNEEDDKPKPEPAPEPDDNTSNASSEEDDKPKPDPKPVDPSKICTKEGYVRDPNDCSIFYYCLSVNNLLVPQKMQCFFGLVYDQTAKVCNYKELVQC